VTALFRSQGLGAFYLLLKVAQAFDRIDPYDDHVLSGPASFLILNLPAAACTYSRRGDKTSRLAGMIRRTLVRP
jgi:hypothetical protein